METLGKNIPVRMSLFNIPMSCKCDSKKFLDKYHDKLREIFQTKYEDLLPTINQIIHEHVAKIEEAKVCAPETTAPEESEVCTLPDILELPEEAEVTTGHIGEQQKRISFSENVEILHITTPVSSASVNTYDTYEEVEIFRESEHKEHVTILLPSEEDSHSSTIKTIRQSFQGSILSFDSTSEELLQDEETNVDKTIESIEEEIINITNEEYLRKYKDILEDKHKIKNMLVIIEEKLNASASGIEEILLKDLKRNMSLVKDLFNMLQLKESEIEKIEHIPLHMEHRRKTDLELWIVIQDLSITIDSLPIKPRKSIPRLIFKNESFLDKHQKITPRLKTFETIEEKLYKISHEQFSSQSKVEEEGMYDKYSERDDYRFLLSSDTFQEDISGELSGEDLSTDKISDRDYSFAASEKSEEYNPFMKQAKYYLQTHHIQQFFRFLGAHLVAASPANPIQYLIDLLYQCYEYRNGRCTPPLLFEQRHIESLYHALDPIGIGAITMDQYCTGMFTLGVPNYTHSPGLNQHFMVNKETFIKDASTKLKEHLDEMLHVPDQSILLSSGRTSTARSG